MGINAEYMGTLIQTSLPNSNPPPQKDFLSTKAFSLTRERHRLVPMRQVDSVAENDAQLLKLNNAVSGLPSSGRKTRVGRIWHFLFMTYIRTYIFDWKPLRHKLQSTPPFRVTEDGKNQVRREDRGQHPRQIRLQLLHVGQRWVEFRRDWQHCITFPLGFNLLHGVQCTPVYPSGRNKRLGRH